jgi:hypothetical protein
VSECLFNELKAVFAELGVLCIRDERVANGDLATSLMLRSKCGAVGRYLQGER